MTQTILNFKLESTNEKLTPRTGVAILGEYLKGMKLEQLCNENLPKAKALKTPPRVGTAGFPS
jgi:hypothetical protein